MTTRRRGSSGRTTPKGTKAPKSRSGPKQTTGPGSTPGHPDQRSGGKVDKSRPTASRPISHNRGNR